MTTDLQFGLMHEEETPAVARILALAFGGTVKGTTEWIGKSGPTNIRVLRPTSGAAKDPQACLLRIPMGEFFGGRSVPLIGIAGVGVAPEARGRGVAGRLMAEAVKEMAAEGAPLSGLYPATQPLYRRVGYEQSGHRFEIRLSARLIDCRERGMSIRAVDDADQDRIRECYHAFASAHDGPLDRSAYVWSRIRQMRETTYSGFAAVSESGAIEGYVYLTQQRKPNGRQDLELSDLAFTTPRAGRRLLAFLEDFSSMADDIVFRGGPTHPALMLLSEQRATLSLHHWWMLRILNVKQAFEARGYAPGVRGEVHLDVRDELVPANQQKWTIRVEGGRAAVQPGGRGDLKLGIGALAPLFSGFLSAEQLSLMGLAEGTPETLRAAAGVFPASTPWMSDMY